MSEIRLILDSGAEAKTLKELIGDLKQYRDLLNEIKNSKTSLVSSDNISDVSTYTNEIEKLKKKVDDLTASNKKQKTEADELQKLESKLIKLREKEAVTIQKVKEQISEQNKLNKQAARDQLGLTTEYEKASRSLNELIKKYQTLALTGRENGVVGRGLLQTIQEQDTKLKELDATTGRYQRNVGNYTGSILTATKGLSGFAGIIAKVGSILGFNTAALAENAHAAKELVNIAKDLSKTAKAASLATVADSVAKKENAAATEGLTVIQRIYNVVVGQSTGAMKAFRVALAATGLGAAIFLLYEITKSMGLFGGETEDASDSVEKLKESVLDFREATKQLNESLLNLKKTQLQSIADILKARIAAGEKGLQIQRELTDAEKHVIEQQLQENRVKTAINLKEQELIQEKLNAKNKEFSKDIVENGEQNFKLQFSQNGKLLSELSDQEKIQAQADLKRKKAEFADLLAEKIKLNDQIQINEISFQGEVKEINNQALEDLKKKLEKEQKEWEEWEKAIRAIRRKGAEQQLKELEEQLKKEEALRLKQIEKELALRETLLSNYFDILQTNSELNRTELQKRQDDLTNDYNIQIGKLIQARKLQIITEEEFNDAKLKLEENFQNDIDKLNDEANKKRIEDAIETEEQVTKVIFDAQQQRLENEKKQTENELSEIDRRIKLQADRANLGLSNNLAEEEKLRADALARKAEIEEKEQKLAEIKQLTEMFFEFVKIYAKDGDKNAELKALAKTFAVKSISGIFASGLYEGTESVGPEHAVANLNRDKDNLLVPLHPSERVIGVDDSKKLRGMSNEDVVAAAMLYKMSNINTDGLVQDKSRKQQLDEALVTMLKDEIASLKETVKNKPVSNLSANDLGEIVDKRIERGIERTIIHKHPLDR